MFNFKFEKGKHFQRDSVSFIKISHLFQLKEGSLPPGKEKQKRKSDKNSRNLM